MRGAETVGRPGPEWGVLGLLFVPAALVLLANETGDGRFVTGYAALSGLFLLTALAWGAHLYLNRPGRVDLWLVLLLFAVLFFAAGGITGPYASASPSTRVGLAIQALLLLAIGLIASLAGFRLLCPPGGTGSRKAGVLARVQATRLPVVAAAAAVVWSLRTYAASQGMVLSHAGDVMTEVSTGGSMAIQLSLLGRPLILFLGAALATDRRPLRRGAGLLIVAGELLYSVLWARRLLFELIVALLLVGCWAGRRLRARQIVAYGSVAAFALLVMWPFMFHLRAVANEQGLYGTEFATRADTLLEQVLPQAIDTFDLAASLETGSEYLENVRERSRALELLMDVQAARQEGTPVMGGRVLLAAVVAIIPRAVWPGKETLMATETWQVEELIQKHFGLPSVDMASTVVTHGYADGGVLGVIGYMALLGLGLAVCERSLGWCRSALLGTAVYALGVSLAVQTEANITDLLAMGRVILALLLVDRLAGRAIERWATVWRRDPAVPRRPA